VWGGGRDEQRGRLLLAAAWGFLCGLAYASFFGHVWRLQQGDEADPAPIPSLWVAVIKGVGFALAIVALVLTLRREQRTGAANRVEA